MAQEKTVAPEETLDSEDWEPIRTLGHRIGEEYVKYQERTGRFLPRLNN